MYYKFTATRAMQRERSPRGAIVPSSVASCSTISPRSHPTEPRLFLLRSAREKAAAALPDRLLSVPAVVTAAYRLTPILAAEADVSWLIPVQQSVEMGSGVTVDRKAPDILAYQAGLRAGLSGTTWSPYLAAGAGAMTYLSNTDADRLPKLDKSQTMFAMNFGGGAQLGLNSRWGLRADFREFVAFPGKDAAGFSTNGSADPIWMERGTAGIAYRF